MYSQYGEEQTIDQFFRGRKNGFLVDVGAMDGITYSNSRYLIESHGWGGVLVEPHPEYFKKLKSLYAGSDRVLLKQCGCFNEEREADFFLYAEGKDACVSTISHNFKQRVINAHGDRFAERPIKIQLKTLDSIMPEREIDFLSIDCEGVDMEVLQSNDWSKKRPQLVCVECSMEMQTLIDFMLSVNYDYYHFNGGNCFFTRK